MPGTDEAFESLSRRMLWLESQNRLLKILLVGSMFSVILVFLMQSALSLPDEIEARRFVLRDGEGNVRAVLATPDAQQGGLTIFDAQERPRLTVGMAPDTELVPGGPIVGFYDPEGKRFQMARDWTSARKVFLNCHWNSKLTGPVRHLA